MKKKAKRRLLILSSKIPPLLHPRSCKASAEEASSELCGSWARLSQDALPLEHCLASELCGSGRLPIRAPRPTVSVGPCRGVLAKTKRMNKSPVQEKGAERETDKAEAVITDGGHYRKLPFLGMGRTKTRTKFYHRSMGHVQWWSRTEQATMTSPSSQTEQSQCPNPMPP